MGTERPKRTPPENTSGPPSPGELPERWSAQRKTELVLRLLRGEALDAVSRDSQVDGDLRRPEAVPDGGLARLEPREAQRVGDGVLKPARRRRDRHYPGGDDGQGIQEACERALESLHALPKGPDLPGQGAHGGSRGSPGGSRNEGCRARRRTRGGGRLRRSHLHHDAPRLRPERGLLRPDGARPGEGNERQEDRGGLDPAPSAVETHAVFW